MRFRAPVPADAPAVLAVFEARDRADLGEVEHRLEDLRDEWRGSDLDLARDAQIAEEVGGQIVGYAAVRRPGTLVVVAPDHEGRGIGSRLLEWAEGRDRDRRRDVHRQWVAANNASARALLTAAGYHRARTYWQMARSLDEVPAARHPPVGFRPSFGRPRAGRSRAVRGRRGELRVGPRLRPAAARAVRREVARGPRLRPSPEPGGHRGRADRWLPRGPAARRRGRWLCRCSRSGPRAPGPGPRHGVAAERIRRVRRGGPARGRARGRFGQRSRAAPVRAGGHDGETPVRHLRAGGHPARARQ